MNKKQIVSLIGLLFSIVAFIVSVILIANIGVVNTVTTFLVFLLLASVPATLIFAVLLTIFSFTKKNIIEAKKQNKKKDEERTFKEGLKRTPWYIWLIVAGCCIVGIPFLIIPPLGMAVLALGFAAFWLPYYTWKNEHIRAPWPSGKLTPERITRDVQSRHKFKTIKLPFEYRIVEDVVVETDWSLSDDYTPTTITFQKSGTYKIKPSMFQKYYSPIEIAMHIQKGEGVYLIFSEKTRDLEFVYRKNYCSI